MEIPSSEKEDRRRNDSEAKQEKRLEVDLFFRVKIRITDVNETGVSDWSKLIQL